MKKAWFVGMGTAAVMALLLLNWACSKTEPEEEPEVTYRIPEEDSGEGETGSTSGGTSYNAAYLAGNSYFINWVNSVARNSMDVHSHLRATLGTTGLQQFRKASESAQTNEDVERLIATWRIDTAYVDTELAEHLAYGLLLKQKNEWLWQLSVNQRNALIGQALSEGWRSTDARWTSLRQWLTGLYGSTAVRVSDAEALDCLWATLNSAASIVGGASSLVFAVNEGNWSAAVSAAKTVLRSARRYSWLGLVWAAIDVATCLWNANAS